ncbi:MAG: dihydroneopterin aldolase [Tannerella sp.]|jgi:dihydroneopterin aldolase|nr:dihydroneopterin aldolase [Tannerella sp.]
MNVLIELSEMKFYAFHGVSAQEKAVGNIFTVDISYRCPSSEACSSDNIEDTVSYADVYCVVKKEMECPSRLLEHLAARISTSLKAGFPQLTYLKIRVSKANPPLGGEVKSASVVIEHEWI